MEITIQTKEKIERFIKKYHIVYYSEVRALEKKKLDKPLIPKVNFESLNIALLELKKEKKISIDSFAGVKIITWVD